MEGNVGLFNLKIGVKTQSHNCYPANLNIIFLDAGCTGSTLTNYRTAERILGGSTYNYHSQIKCAYVQKHKFTQCPCYNRSILPSVILTIVASFFYDGLICKSSAWLSVPHSPVSEASVSSKICPVSPIKLHLTHVVLTSLEIRGSAENEQDHFPNSQTKHLINSFGAAFNTELRHMPEIKPLKFQTSRLVYLPGR